MPASGSGGSSTHAVWAQQRSTVEPAPQYAELAVSVSPLATPRVVLRDVDDDHVIAAALVSGAEIVVSGDWHLLWLGGHQGIAIVNAAAAVRRVDDARSNG